MGIYQHLGFPQYFRRELGVAKIVGVILLLIPAVPVKIKDWVYAGFGITLVSGAIAHFSSGDHFGYIVNVFFWLALLVVSYIYWQKLTTGKIAASLNQHL